MRSDLTHCRGCQFAQDIGGQRICRHRDVGQVLAASTGQWYLDPEQQKAPCTEFFTRRVIPKGSPVRDLVGPGRTKLIAIAETARIQKIAQQKAAVKRQESLF